MIRLHIFDGHHLTETPFEGFDSLPECDWLWLDLVAEPAHRLAELGDRYGFDELSLEDAMTEDMLPKVDRFEGYHYVALHALDTVGERLGTIEYDLFLSDGFLVTVREKEIHGIDRLFLQFAAPPQPRVTSPAELTALIVDAGSQRVLQLLDVLEDRIEDLEDRAMRADATVIGEAQALRRDVIVLRRAYGPQRDVLAALSRDPAFDDAAQRAFADVYDHSFRLIESLDSARALLGSVQDTHRGAIAERTNEVMKVLTVFSATMLPLTLLTGIWGMNLASLPGQTDMTFFWVLVGAMIGIVLGLWVFFARRGFVGHPPLRKLPKAVGLTLTQIGTAPLRAVARPVGSSIRWIVGTDGGERSGPPTGEDHVNP